MKIYEPEYCMDPNDKIHINRTLSTPNAFLYRRITEEYYFGGDHRPVHRQISCEQIFDPALSVRDSDQSFKNLKIQAITDEAPNKSYDSPMEVDINESDQSKNLSCKETEFIETEQFKPESNDRKFKMITEKEQTIMTQRSRMRVCLRIFVCSLAIAVVAVFYEACNFQREVNFSNITEHLKANLIYQSEPAVEIGTVLNDIIRANKTELNLLIFVGTTGVGKTYCSNIIKQRIQPLQVYDVNIHQPSLNHIKFFSHVTYLLVVDNLTVSDIDIFLKFLHVVPKNSLIIIISIFNIQDTKDNIEFVVHDEHIDIISNRFKEVVFPVHMVPFNRLNKDVVRQNIGHLALSKYKGYTKKVEAYIEEHDFDRFGFKGFFAKLDLLFEKRESDKVVQ